jgi:CHAT domain-containing protein
VESIKAMLPAPATLLIGSQATKQSFERLPLASYRVLHLALHGLTDPVYPDHSALAFAPAGNDDGRLEARDIRKLRLNADLVTLSACNTGVGPVDPSGVDSLVTAFIQAGAASVVATLWGPEDHAASEFMKSFYGNVTKLDEANALRQAQLTLLRLGVQPYD